MQYQSLELHNTNVWYTIVYTILLIQLFVVVEARYKQLCLDWRKCLELHNTNIWYTIIDTIVDTIVDTNVWYTIVDTVVGGGGGSV